MIRNFIVSFWLMMDWFNFCMVEIWLNVINVFLFVKFCERIYSVMKIIIKKVFVFCDIKVNLKEFYKIGNV